MLHNYMGDFRFQKGLRAYFERFKYSNASTKDLWAALETTGVSGVAELMSLWTKQTGYPVIFARPIHASDGTHSIGLKQQRFLADSTSARSEPPVRWRIPIAVCDVKDSKSIFLNKITFGADSSLSKVPCRGVRSQPSASTDVGSEETIYTLPNVVQAPQVRLNPDAIGFYRVRYDSIMLDTIMDAISSGAIPTRDRIALLDDQFALARAGLQGLDKALNFCLAFVGERRYSVWSVLSECLAEVRILLEEATYPEKDGIVFPQPSSEICGLDKLCAELALPVYAKIGFTPNPKDSNRVQILRPIIISILGSIGYSDVITRAQSAFQHHYRAAISELSDRITKGEANLIPPDLRSAVYSICMRNGGEEEFSMLLDLYSFATLDDERVRILSSLGAATDANIIHRLFNFTFTEEIRKQDRFHVLLGATVTAGGRRALWNLVRTQFARLSKDLGTSHLLGKVLAGSISGFASLKHYEDIKAFFERHDTPCPRVIAQALESVRIRMEQWKRDEVAVREFLNSQYPPDF
ncbi:unnamed protein product [Hydatigera taeniaeformis]|uniref:ERAP1_C domain-containing protein n=1 Tax=Hydatigena taeniaeformis TaxID=6205 RepID=A0A0R3WR10_HYDTA|nr:unnamed protein product [Hydatigera taeniaeformis]